jgi:hypothetical protein
MKDKHIELLRKRHPVKPGEEERIRQSPKKIKLYFGNTCSLKCEYCTARMYEEKRQRRPSVLDWLPAATYVENIRKIIGNDNVVIRMDGPGEVVEHPEFFDVAEPLFSDGHPTVIMTNLLRLGPLWRLVKAFPLEEIRDRLRLVVSYHLGTYLDRPNSEKSRSGWLKRMRKLAPIGMKMHVMTPLTPGVLRDKKYVSEMDALRSIWREGMFSVNALELGRTYQGKRYPASYTPEEAARVKEVMAAVGSTRHTVADGAVLKLTSPPYRLQGMTCFIRMQTLRIGVDGSIFSCVRKKEDIIGNVSDLSGVDLEEFRKPIECPYEKCTCKGKAWNNCLGVRGITPDIYYRAFYLANYGLDIDDPDQRDQAEDLLETGLTKRGDSDGTEGDEM